MVLRPCWVCRQPVLDGHCARHPRTAYQYRPNRPSVIEGAGSRAAQKLRLIVLERDRCVCAYCDGGASTMDHVVPRSRGGATDLANLVACCAACNNSKHDKTLAEWIATGSAPAGALRMLELTK